MSATVSHRIRRGPVVATGRTPGRGSGDDGRDQRIRSPGEQLRRPGVGPGTGLDPAAGAAAVRIGVWHIAAPGALLCLAVSIVLLFFLPQLREANATIWLWTFLAATGWSLIGLSIYGWQRRAARRGARGVSRSALDEVIGRGGSSGPTG